MTGLGDTALVVLAAGLSRRYGAGNKLLHPFRGKPLVAHIAELGAQLPVKFRIAVCPPDAPELDVIFTGAGFEIARNRDPASGQASSLACGISTAAATDAEAAIVCLGDMPGVTADHLGALLGALETAGATGLSCSIADGVRMPPVAISARRFGAFAALSGDKGGRDLLAEAAPVAVDADLLADYDTREQLERAGA
ncbi:molybdenum cofactor cytidylyltransferase [Devosia enhydra]|uniref:Molybdenum cofactor cytidylyltransferase n=1 Tax=Devosia enhydra TaxID=665118 RepID=A0A1K2HT23_9HYPH|nr:nucleotidyltransferase family protein [Devosia enhydra]SFZ81259.1 molybdenum cofactor cytidylyltransferase [Devosia enhydra]